MIIALLAAGAMLITDVIAVVMVQAEAADRGWLAGACDTAGWYFGIATTTISVTALQGHSITEKIAVLVLVGAANLFGTKLGQVTGHRILTRKTQPDSRSEPLSATDLRELREGAVVGYNYSPLNGHYCRRCGKDVMPCPCQREVQAGTV